MCLNTKYGLNRKRKFIDEIPEEGIKVYKVVNKLGNGTYRSIFHCSDYHDGLNIAYKEVITTDSYWGIPKEYLSGFHFFKSKRTANKYISFASGRLTFGIAVVVEAIVKKGWVNEVGEDGQHYKSRNLTVVASKAIFNLKG